MSALTPTFLFDFESEMQRLTENEFARLISGDNLWWRDVARVRPSGKKREFIAWLLSTAQIRDEGLGGNMNFDDMAATFKEYDIKNAGEGLTLTVDQVEDNDGNGFDFAAEWSSQMGAQMAYWPQKKIAALLLNGAATDGSALAYDGVPFFSGIGATHPYNQFRPSAGGFANIFTGAASGSYPGALPIDESVSLDVAVQNIGKALAYIASVKMPNGVDPRFLRARRLMVPPRLVPRAQQITNARYIAQAATGGAGTGDIEAIVSNWGFMQPLEVQEFAGATYTGGANADTTWHLLTESVTTTQLGALVYVDREPFRITYYTGAGGGTGVDAILDRARELEWHVKGRNVAGYGHPYAIFRGQST